MNISNVKFFHILEAEELIDLRFFLSHTAFVISHKAESSETLRGVIWYLPTNSPIIIVTNCPQDNLESLKADLKEHVPYHRKVYLVHQKDRNIAEFFHSNGVPHILGHNGRVRDGKGEGMYIGALCAILLSYPQWLVFYDADNHQPAALLEYSLAMGRLFTSTPLHNGHSYENGHGNGNMSLHNVRICWASKPEVNGGSLDFKGLGRCTSIVSPLVSNLLEEWFGIPDYPIISSNAGEQGMTISTAKALRFSSGYSVETFQFIDFLFQASGFTSQSRKAQLHQYLSKSAHFHTKKGDDHIKKMIAESLGAFLLFHEFLPQGVKDQLRQICDNLDIEMICPLIYPRLETLMSEGDEMFVQQYKLFEDCGCDKSGPY